MPETVIYRPTFVDQSVANGGTRVHSPLTNGLAGYWRMEEASWDGSEGEIIDSSGNSGDIVQNLITYSDDMTAGAWAGTAVVTALTAQDNSAVGALSAAFAATVETLDQVTVTSDIPKDATPTFYPCVALTFVTGGTTTISGVVVNTLAGTIVDRVTGGNWIPPDNSSITAVDKSGVDYWRVTVSKQNNGTGNTKGQIGLFPAVTAVADSGTFVVATQGTTTFENNQISLTSSPLTPVATTGVAISELYNHGKMQGGGTLASVAGKLGQAFDANGVNYFVFPPAIFPQEAGTIAMWVKSNASLTSPQSRFWSTDDTGGTSKEHRTSGDGVSSAIDATFLNEAAASVTVSQPATFANDTWVLVCWRWLYDATANETTITGCLNAVDGTPGTVAGKLKVPDTSFNIGEWNGTVIVAPAEIDEAAIWNRALSKNEVLEIYNAGLGSAVV